MIKNIKHLLLMLMVFTMACSSCKKEKTPFQLEIIATTDVHGTIFPHDFIKDTAINHSLSHIYSYVSEQRKQLPGSVILLDNGDFFQGQPSVYYYNFEDTTGEHLGSQVLNFMGYDAATVGNHDIEAGHAVYDELMKTFTFDYLAANAIDKKTGEPYFKPYTVIERHGAKIAVLGLITPGIPNWLPENLWQGLEFADMVETANKWVPIIKEKEQPDVLVGLFHAGVDHTFGNETGETYMNENASKLVAEKVAGFDVIIAGHDHQKHNLQIINPVGDTVYLVDPRSHARAFASISLAFDYAKSGRLTLKKISPSIINSDQFTVSEPFMTKFKDAYQDIEHYVSQPIGEFTNSISTKYAYFGNSAFIDLIHQVQLANTNARVSFSAPLSFNAAINKGPVYVRDLFKLYKYENMLYTLKLTGSEIDKYLEYSYAQWFNQMRSTHDHLLNLEKSDNGTYYLKSKYFNLSSASGIDYLVDVSKPEGKRVKILGFSNGDYFYSDSTYKVAVNSYRGNGGGGHLTEGVGLPKEELKSKRVSSTDKDLRYLLMQYIKEQQKLSPAPDNNWRIIPEDFYEKASDRDFQLLFD